MIWDSTILMTIIDLAIICLTTFAYKTFNKQRTVLETLELKRGIQIIFVGLVIITLFYLLDLITMFVLPIFMPMGKSMAIMKHLHLNQKWLVSLFGTGFLVIGLNHLLGKLLPDVNELLAKLRSKDQEQKKTITELAKALEEIKTLQGIIPICAYCKKIRNDEGAWNIMEAYITEHTHAIFSHGVCPGCYKKQMEDLDEDDK